MESKKNPKLDYQKKSALFFNIGLVLSLLLVISAFEWKINERTVVVDRPASFVGDPILSPPITNITPPKPKVQVINLIEVIDEKEIDVPDFEVVVDIEGGTDIEPEVIFDEPVEVAEETLIFAETMPSFIGGIGEFYKFVGKHLKYPSQARRLGIEGKVFVNFVVDKDGNLSDINVVKGIGAGCDAEVIRIIRMSPKWNPGKQRGRPVKVQMMMPITFQLQ